MRIERRTVHELLDDGPDQRVLGRLDLKAEASGLGAGEGDVLGQVLPDRGGLGEVSAEEPPGELDDVRAVLVPRTVRRPVIHRLPLPGALRAQPSRPYSPRAQHDAVDRGR
ncbi:hypothetical protein JOD52_002357 [Brachybacterium muris]|nr:hypothetical protein [Brachybacterium muris]MCT2178444.1 hypothetical protein [Brachybacterium muris]MCT2261319.1 hypothetical protein [Brachybacterium muris]